jgi:hypothetical protein
MLVCVRPNAGIPDREARLAECHVPVEAGSDHQGVQQRTDNVMHTRPASVGDLGADGDIWVVAATRGGDHGHRKKHHVDACVKFARECPYLVCLTWRDEALEMTTLVGQRRQPICVAGQHRTVGDACQFCGPEEPVLGSLWRPQLGLLHAGVVGVLKRQARRRHLRAGDSGSVNLLKLPQQDASSTRRTRCDGRQGPPCGGRVSIGRSSH